VTQPVLTTAKRTSAENTIAEPINRSEHMFDALVGIPDLRDAILALSDHDRKRLAALLGCMHDAKPSLSHEVPKVLTKIGALHPNDWDRLASWCYRGGDRCRLRLVGGSSRLNALSESSIIMVGSSLLRVYW